MKYTVVVLIGFASIIGAVSCTKAPEPQTSTPVASAATENVAATIGQLERDWVTAISKKDASVLERLLADDFVGTSPTAHTYTRTNAIDDIKNGKYAVDAMDLDEISVNVYGTTAVSFTSQEEKSHYAGTETSGHYHFTDVWVKKDGRWQVVASHGTRYDKPAATETRS